MANEKLNLINSLTVKIAESDCSVSSIMCILQTELYNYDVTPILNTTLITTDGSLSEMLYEQFEEYKLANGVKKNSLKVYKYTIFELQRFANKELNVIEEEDLLAFFSYLRYEKKIMQSSLANKQMYLSTFFKYLYDHKKIEENPVSLMSYIRPKCRVKIPLTDIEAEELVIACGSDLYKLSMVYILLYTGIRISELCRIQFKDIDFLQRTVLIHGKGDSDRILPINEKTMARIKDFLYSREDIREDGNIVYDSETYMFPAFRGKKPLCVKSAERIIHDLSVSSGIIRLHPHLLRSTFATNMYKQGFDIYTISKMLGHKSISTTTRYILFADDSLKNIVVR